MTCHPERLAFVARVRRVRQEVYGDEGVARLAQELGIPPRTWKNYEAGVTIPDTTLLGFVCLAGISPRWLLTGEGPPYSSHADPDIQLGQA